jgi:NAD+ synthetase
MMPPELLIQELCNWLAQQLPRAATQGVVMRIHGGVDCALVAALAQQAFGKNVLALVLPCHSRAAELDEAMLLIDHFKLRHVRIDLSSVYDAFSATLRPVADQEANDILQRLRMMALYHFAALNNYLVLGTINRSNWEIGNFVRYGDDACDIQPLMHLLQKDVATLAEHLRLPRRIMQEPAAPDFGSGQKSSLEFGFTKLELDDYLGGAVQGAPDLGVKIQIAQQEALRKKQAPLRLSQATITVDTEGYGQEAYDKSIEALTIISKAITSDQYLEDILRLIVMVTAEVMNSSVCSLWLVDDKEGVLRLRATQSINSEYLKDRVLKVGEGIVGKVVAENHPYIAANVLTDPCYKEKELARSMGLVSMISVPMRVKDRVIGVINCYTSHPHVFSDLQMNLFTAVANQAAVAIENTELIVQTKVIQAELENRKLIERAKDLIMKRFGLSGEEAYRWLQKRSMNTRKSMRQVSEAVLLAMEV